jgi:carbonic anhydrase/acetyltransferase-like protein (isoleucine patch superfamily)
VTREISRWLFGAGVVAPGDPLQRVEADETSFPACRTIEFPGNAGAPVQMGRYSGMHATATIMHSGEHHTDCVSLLGGYRENGEWVVAENAFYDNGPVVIGSDVWIGFEALIMSGVTIGDGAVVGARTTLRRSVQPYEIVVGNPARHVGFRFDEPIREALLRIKWWDWPEAKIAAHKDQIFVPDAAGFVERHDPALGAPSCSLCS